MHSKLNSAYAKYSHYEKALLRLCLKEARGENIDIDDLQDAAIAFIQASADLGIAEILVGSV